MSYIVYIFKQIGWNGATTLVTAITLFATIVIAARTHKSSKRIFTQQALNELARDTQVDYLPNIFDGYPPSEPIPHKIIAERLFSKIDDRKNEKRHKDGANGLKELYRVLNAYDGLASGVISKVYDEEIVLASRRNALIETCTRYEAFIDAETKTTPGRKDAWNNLITLAERWTASK